MKLEEGSEEVYQKICKLSTGKDSGSLKINVKGNSI